MKIDQDSPLSTHRAPLERVLSLFADVRGGEAGNTLLLTLSIFLILTSYYIGKVVREPLILAGGGAELKAYSSALQAITLVPLMSLYAWMVAKFNRRKLLMSVTIFFAACFVAFYFLGLAETPYIGVAYFVWVGIFSLTVIAQFWSFANDIHTPDEGKRLFAIIAFGGSSGAVAGAWIASRLIEIIGVYQLLLVSAALLAVSLVLVNVVEARKQQRRRELNERAATAEAPVNRGDAFKVVFSNRYLLLIALLILVLNFVNTTGEYLLSSFVKSTAEATVGISGDAVATKDAVGKFIGKFYADFFFWVNLLGLIIQLFLVSRIIKYLGVLVALLVLPVIAFGGYAIFAAAPALMLIRWAKTAENATDYSINNTVRQVLFLPTTREQKYKAKVAIDSFFVRAGDVLSAGLVYAGVNWLAFQLRHFAWVNLTLVVVWIVLAILIGRENKKLMAASGAQGS